MLSRSEVREYQRQAAARLRGAGVALAPADEGAIEIADFGLGRFEKEGLGLLVYVNNERYCAKELVMWPRQRCPQHRHPPFGGGPGKMETFRCRWGRVRLFVGEAGEGTPSGSLRSPPPPPAAGEGAMGKYQLLREVGLEPGGLFTIPPDTWHWFEAGEEGAVVSEFSSASRDELDVFLDERVRRETVIG